MDDFMKYLNTLSNRYRPNKWITFIDSFDNNVLTGWAKLKNNNSSQFITIAINNKIFYNSFLANIPRLDVKEAGYGTGLYGFKLNIDMSQLFYPICIIQLIDPKTDDIISFKLYSIN